MPSPGARRKILKWTLIGVFAAALLPAGLITAMVLGHGAAEREGDVDLRSLPRFGELVRKVDRAVRQRPDEGDLPSEQTGNLDGGDIDRGDIDGGREAGAEGSEAIPGQPAFPPPPAVDRSTFPLEPTPEADAAWKAPGRKSILEVQRYAIAHKATADGSSGSMQGSGSQAADSEMAGSLIAGTEIIVTDLAPRHGMSFVAEIRSALGRSAGGPWHLQNADPAGQLLRATADGLLLVTDRGEEECQLWPGGDPSLLEAAAQKGRELGAAWIPLCGKPARVFLRLPVSGRKTRKEWTSDFLRDNLPAGEKVTVLVRKTLFADSELRVGVLEVRASGIERQPGAPPRVAIDPRWSDLTTAMGDFGLAASGVDRGAVPVGRWLPLADGRDGVWVSLFQPRLTDSSVVRDSRLQPLDEVESSSMVYLVAFDLDDHEVSFALGTDHPRLGWSERVPTDVGDRRKQGPDGFDDGAPLVRAGQVPPWLLADLQATFTGGFKRSHGAFKWGDLSRSHDGSHYGFVEDGVVWSKPMPGLATVTVWDDGRVDLHTWTEDDDRRLARVRHLRQNGVPLLAPETAADGSEKIRVGSLVGRWGDGNWSGTQDQKLRSVRAGLCLTESLTEGPTERSLTEGPREGSAEETNRYLIYGWFSAGTPSGMAKVFLAYHCRYALLLDMNALEHTYLSILTPKTTERPIPAGSLRVEHLVRGMEVLDEPQGGVTLPRFAGFADNRDFFYLTRKSEAAGP